MKNVRNIFMIIQCCMACMAYSQSSLNHVNFEKYWWYRHRLVNDFVVIGDCQGCSLPMAQRAADVPTSTAARWGDNTINLGNYIAVLATEYRLLKMYSQPTDSTVKELYYALKAFNRLDNSAESVFRCANCPIDPQPGDLNGFFIRDDVSETFLDEHPHISEGIITARPVDTVRSDYTDYIENQGWFAMSHDQVWSIFMGLALVSKYVDDPVTFDNKELNDVDHNQHIRQEAKNIAARVTNQMKDHNWTIKNPVTGVVVDPGGILPELSYGAAEAACFIENANVTPNPGFPIHSCNTYHDIISLTDAPIWNNLGRGIGSFVILNDEDFKSQIIAAMGNSWWTSVNPFIPDPVLIFQTMLNPGAFLNPGNFVNFLTSILPLPPVNVTSAELAPRAIFRDYQHLTLLRQDLHGGTNLISPGQYDALIDSAPCEGPWCYSYPDDSAPFEWSTSNRLHKPDERGGAAGAHYNYGEFNGLDYMLYYNLFAISQNTTGVIYSNYMHRTITYPFPITGTVGTHANPTVVEAFSTIDALNTINNTAEVTYRAGKQVHLGPGFQAHSGATFHAYIDPFECGAGGEYRSTNPVEDNMSTAAAYAGQTTFVNYPARQNTAENYPQQELPAIVQSNPVNENTVIEAEPAKPAGLSDIRIYPNPNNGTFTVAVTGQNSIHMKLTVMTVLGRPVLEQFITATSTVVDITGQAKGIYYVKIESNEGVTMEKIICQ